MKKQIHILEGLMILLFILIAGLLTIRFIYKINHEEVDTSYMWNINFTNMNIKEGSKKGSLSLNDNTIYLDVTLNNDTEFFEFTLDIENNGSLNAKIDELNIDKESNNEILTYKITYEDDTEIKEGDILKSKSKTTIKVRIEYPKQKDKIYESLNLKLSFKINYIAEY